MSLDDSFVLRQNNEFEVLQAIYGDDLTDLRSKAVWNKWQPLNFKISLNPLQSSKGYQDVYAKVDLHITCGDTYPKNVPKIELECPKGLSQNSLEELKNGLENRAAELKSEEMVFQLAQYVQEFLLLHNKPASKSFYDEMLQRQKEREQKDFEAKQIEEDIQRQLIRQEVQKRQEILKAETKLWRDIRHSETSTDDYDLRRQSSSDNSEEHLCNHKNTAILEFGPRQIKRGRCLRHCNDHTVFVGIDINDGELVLISEWIVNCSAKQLITLEQEFNYLVKLRKHQNLIHYTNFKQEPTSDFKTAIYILKEHIVGLNCAFFLNETFNLSIQCIKHIAKGVLTALDYLHRNNIVHKDIKDSCVYITESGQVSLANYSLHRRLCDIFNNTSTNYCKKSDIYQFGVFILSLLQGYPITEFVEIPDSVSTDLHDFLEKCLAKQDRYRWSASQLLNHRFLSHSEVAKSPDKTNLSQDNRNVSPDMVTTDLAFVGQNGQSRINQEFVFIANLGKGAFGDVIKARNNLDGRFYAIKRIKLNPRNKQLNKKIVREVKLLSRLNHENIVRYYNSWIEMTLIKNDDLSEFNSTTSSVTDKRSKIEFTLQDNVEELAPPINSIEVSIKYDSKSQGNFIPSSESSSDDEENWGNFEVDSDSDGIEFEHNEEDDKEITERSEKSNKYCQIQTERQIEFMYIQMEFCERNTLRQEIDNCVYLDEDRVWRLFREIVEGLAHIHQQGMIHRDLKPVNIFLDSYDHVKIGDFGLATNMKSMLNEISSGRLLQTEEIMDESKTGLIGTALYVAPELSVASKANYNQKVDIYSLGIILFEMCYPPLPTTMERITVLSNLRKKDLQFPNDFPNNPKQKFLIKWLLNHDISNRPTSQELLQSEHVPPPVLEECELRELIRHTLNNPQLKGYKYLIASCFEQTLTAAQDITFDRDPSMPTMIKPLALYDYVKSIIIKVFKQHGARNLPTPLLMPKSHYHETQDSSVKLMTHFGGIMSLPHDLRVPFARYVAWNGITLFRRYSIERVYREKKVYGFHPRELYECAFDIVTPNPGNHLSDAEVLYATYEILNELPGLKNKQVTVRLNHVLLTKAILFHFGVKEKHQEVLRKFLDVKEGKTPRSDLASLGLSDNAIASLLNIFGTDFQVSKFGSQLQQIVKIKSPDVQQALHELRGIAHHAEAFGVTFDMFISPGVFYNIQQYTGMICQFVCELHKKHRHGHKEVLAAGGRYDSMITSFRKMMENINMSIQDTKQSAVGISLSLEKLVQAVMRESRDELPPDDILDVAVCSVGTKPMLKEKTGILRTLWGIGIRAVMIESTNIEEIREQRIQLNVPHLIMIKDSDPGTARVHSWEKERFQERSFKVNELVENISRLIKTWKDDAGILNKSDSKTCNDKHEHQANVTVLFVTVDKLSANARKRHELQIRSNLELLFKKLNDTVIVLALWIESSVIRTIASHLEWETDQLFYKTVQIIIERHQRHKKYLSDICDEIYDLKLNKRKPTIILFSLLDSFHRLLL